MREHCSSPPSVVVGIDGSRSAHRCRVMGRRRSGQSRYPVAARVRDRPRATAGTDPETPHANSPTAEIAVRQAFMAVESTDKPVKIEVEILQDRPTRALLEASRWAAMLCVGSIGLKHSAQGRIGSTAAALAASAHCPVAVVRGHDPLPCETELGGRRGGRVACQRRRLRRALEEAQLRGAPLRVLTTWQSRFTDIHDGHAVAEGNRLAKAQLDRRLAQWKKRHPDLDVRAVAVHGNTLNFLTKNSGSRSSFSSWSTSGPTGSPRSSGLRATRHCTAPIVLC